MKIDWNSKYTTVSVYTVITFAVCLLMVAIFTHFTLISGFISMCVKALSPIIWGAVIAYLLNPVMKRCERWCKAVFDRKKPHPRLNRGISTAASIIFGLAVISALIAIIVPQVLESIVNIFNNIPSYMKNIENYVNELNSKLSEFPDAVVFINSVLDQMQEYFTDAANNLLPKVGDWAIKLRDGALGFITALKDFLIGFIVAVYFLLDKEKFIIGAKKLMSALFPKSAASEILSLSRRTNESLSGFISGKLIDSFIIGVICFISMTIMKMDYAVLISTIIGITNVIPFFGPFIGAIPSAFLLLVSSPAKFFPFVIMIIVLQQFDGNILGPYILGDSTGLPAFWVMFAILFGSALFGFAGMLLGVPIFAVIYAIVQEITEKLLIKRGLPLDDENYEPVPMPPKRHSPNIRLSKGRNGEKKQ